MPYKDKEKQKEYQRNWKMSRRTDYLKDKKCVKCESIDDLEIDHINPKEKISHRFWSWKEERRLQELSKCQVLCRVCHLEKTLEQRGKTGHGKLYYYQKYKCRCALCREVKAESAKKSNQKRKIKREQQREINKGGANIGEVGLI